jgi:hypothetical protein
MSEVCSVAVTILFSPTFVVTRSGEPITSCVCEFEKIGADVNSE